MILFLIKILIFTHLFNKKEIIHMFNLFILIKDMHQKTKIFKIYTTKFIYLNFND
jgi:hypothetical protein